MSTAVVSCPAWCIEGDSCTGAHWSDPAVTVAVTAGPIEVSESGALFAVAEVRAHYAAERLDDAGQRPEVVLYVANQVGNAEVDLSPAEARQLAAQLAEVARAIEQTAVTA